MDSDRATADSGDRDAESLLRFGLGRISRSQVRQHSFGREQDGALGEWGEGDRRLRGQASGLGDARFILGDGSLPQRHPGEAGHRDKEERKHSAQCDQSAHAPLLLTPTQVVERAPQNSRQHFEFGQGSGAPQAAPFRRPNVRGERLDVSRHAPLGVQIAYLNERIRERFPGLALNQNSEDPIVPTQLAESQNFFVDPPRFARPRRTNDNQALRFLQGGVN
ncbi:MAG: hypothetical protein P4L85_12130 [Paludisphaera borealis]|nr:hypothetical protein [Paludisphaera borealis]MDR3620091.1 hypothetical protein [Paludisphaera borealis]